MNRDEFINLIYAQFSVDDGESHDAGESILAEYDRLTALNAQLLEALKEIAKGEGAFSRDPFEHACNCVDNMKAIAVAAIRAAEGEEHA